MKKCEGGKDKLPGGQFSLSWDQAMGRACLPTLGKSKGQWRTVALERGGLYLVGLCCELVCVGGVCVYVCMCGKSLFCWDTTLY